ncbi:MAG: PQQ-binding-like beta-propeller repeat protein [bacterium]|nr:PQQ-binding-like beta-propeller repeat protein [bacterium]
MFINCQKDHSTGPDDNEISGIQQDIPWPSLSDSPWPMFQHDPQGTGRSRYLGPQTGRIVNQFIVNRGGSKLSYTLVDPDDNILLAFGNVWSDSLGETDGYLFKYSPSGERLWYFNIGGREVYHSPLIDANGVIYIGSDDGVFYAINPDGSMKWKYETNSMVTCGYGGPSIGLDGTIYFSNQKALYAIDQSGVIIWSKQDYRDTRVVVSPDGNTFYVKHINVGIAALEINGNLKWCYQYPAKGYAFYPLVDSNCRIYFPYDSKTYIALNEHGELIWSFDISSVNNYSGTKIDILTAPTIDNMGNFYFYTADDLYSIDYTGKLRWIIRGLERNAAHLMCDKNGNIFSVTQFDGAFDVLSITNEGKLNWKTFLYCPEFGFSAASISSQGRLFLMTMELIDYNKFKLYIIE